MYKLYNRDYFINMLRYINQALDGSAIMNGRCRYAGRIYPCYILLDSEYNEVYIVTKYIKNYSGKNITKVFGVHNKKEEERLLDYIESNICIYS